MLLLLALASIIHLGPLYADNPLRFFTVNLVITVRKEVNFCVERRLRSVFKAEDGRDLWSSRIFSTSSNWNQLSFNCCAARWIEQEKQVLVL